MKSNSNQLGADQRPAEPSLPERYYTVADVANRLRLSKDFVRSIFEKEPGVIVFEGEKSSRHKRRYRTMRIPEQVLERVIRRLSRV